MHIEISLIVMVCSDNEEAGFHEPIDPDEEFGFAFRSVEDAVKFVEKLAFEPDDALVHGLARDIRLQGPALFVAGAAVEAAFRTEQEAYDMN